jgi:hypothetical protein
MPGTTKLQTFRDLVLLLLVSALWIAIADGYTEVLVSLAGPLVPDGQSLKALGSKFTSTPRLWPLPPPSTA